MRQEQVDGLSASRGELITVGASWFERVVDVVQTVALVAIAAALVF